MRALALLSSPPPPPAAAAPPLVAPAPLAPSAPPARPPRRLRLTLRRGDARVGALLDLRTCRGDALLDHVDHVGALLRERRLHHDAAGGGDDRLLLMGGHARAP